MPMTEFLGRRLLQLVPTLIFILVVVFVLMRLLPGDPASAVLGDRALDAEVERIDRKLGLDRPLPVQFAVFVRSVLTGDLGRSVSLRIPVARLIAERLPITMALTAMAALIAVWSAPIEVVRP